MTSSAPELRLRGRSASAIGAFLFIAVGPALGGDFAAPADVGMAEAQGQRAFTDPSTGKLMERQPENVAPLTLSTAEKNAVSTSGDGLAEAPISIGRGYKIHLQGRFQSPMIATVDDSGKVRTFHLHPFATGGAESGVVRGVAQ